jgi:hypothetical protein
MIAPDNCQAGSTGYREVLSKFYSFQEAIIMRNIILLSVLALTSVLTGCLDDKISTVAVIGDMPYGANPTDTAEFDASPAFITAINNDPDASLILHAGDIHSGKQYCTQTYDALVYNQWLNFSNPLVYTPGDNEWTDCHKTKEGGGLYNAATGTIDYLTDPITGDWIDYAGGNPLENLKLVRSIFFASPGKTLGGSMTVHTQAQEHDTAYPTDSSYVENVLFEKSDVLFVTLNIPGGSNNDTDPWYKAPSMTQAQSDEVANRTAADLRWLDAAFAKATANGAKAVVIMEQADMWDLDGTQLADGHLVEYKQFIDKIAAKTAAFGKPVLLINGDSHFFRSDNPLVQGAECAVETGVGTATTTCADSVASGKLNGITLADPYDTQPNGYNVANFHRIVVHGNATVSGTPMEWIKLTVDPRANATASENAFGPFSWTREQP